MLLGIDCLIKESSLRKQLEGRKVALLAHPASVTSNMIHSVDALAALPGIRLTSAFGPQHGMRGDKQDNMIESDDYLDPIHKIPVFSLYGKVRRPTSDMMNSFDVILIDLQDLGCRIYTFITTMLYVLEEAAKFGKEVWVLDRPNPAGRPVEGTFLRPGWESFVGAGPLPMRHGLTMAELALWFKSHYKIDVNLKVVPMLAYHTENHPDYGWPIGKLSWINPSPNASNLSMARAYSGTVMVEGTHLSEGRGTTRPLEVIGAPDLDFSQILNLMFDLAPQWLKGCRIRLCHFEPTFNKHSHKLCYGIQFHVDDPAYRHYEFKPYRAVALLFKAIRKLHPSYEIWRDFPYEYETDKLAIDLINGGVQLREWVDNTNATVEDFDQLSWRDEKVWIEERKPFLLY